MSDSAQPPNPVDSKTNNSSNDDFYYHTEKASEVSRNLAFSGLALIWLLTPDHNVESIKGPFLYCLAANVLALTFDFFQYVISSTVFDIYKKIGRCSATIIAIFFYGKLLAVLAGYSFVIIKIIEMIFPASSSFFLHYHLQG